jgi:PA14 domain
VSFTAGPTAIAGSSDHATVVTTGIDTRAANLIVINVWHDPRAGSTPVLTDSKSNAWTPLTSRFSGTGTTQLFYCAGPTTDVSHIFTATGTSGTNPAIAVLSFSGGAVSPFLAETGNNNGPVTSLQPGSLTPAQDDCLVVTGIDIHNGNSLTIDSGFTAVVQGVSPGNYQGGGIAYLLERSAAAVNPTWTWATGEFAAAVMAVFGAAPTDLRLDGPSGGIVGATSLPFSVTPRVPIASDVITPHTDSTGTFSPTSVTVSSAPVTFTYTPSVLGLHNISITDGNGKTISNSPVAYTVNPSPGNVGGGWTNSTQGGQKGIGAFGKYYANSSLSGSPSFTRFDNRINFNWPSSNAYPGGSPSPGFASVGPTNWSATWSGVVVASFSETYTFSLTSAGNGARLWVTPVGSGQGSPLINHWTSHTSTTDTGTIALTAGATYAIQLDLSQTTATAQRVQLQWSSLSTPLETIDPWKQIGMNQDSGDALFANMLNAGQGWTASFDANHWPTSDPDSAYLGSGTVTPGGGSFGIQFNGRAQVTCSQTVDWIVGGVSQGTGTLVAGNGYDAGSNTTRATMVVPSNGTFDMQITFSGSNRTYPGGAAGITNLYVMQPSTLGGSTPVPAGTLFMPPAKAMLANCTVFRNVLVTGTNGSIVSDWADRPTPGQNTWMNISVSGGSGPLTLVTGSTGTGVPWEVVIALANETGKDPWINTPAVASVDYITNLANLFAFGSDGVNPYTSVQANPVWPPLNPNLKVYIEWSNETWNYHFPGASTGHGGWSHHLCQRAIYDYLTGTMTDSLYPGGGANGYNDGAFLAPFFGLNSGNDTAFLASYNPSPAPQGAPFSPAYFPDTNGFGWGQALIGLRQVQTKAAFATAFGETSLYSIDPEARGRPVYEWFYGGTTSGGLNFIDATFSGSHPVNYYLYGGGAGWYAATGFSISGFTDVAFTNPGFATGLTGWSHTGSAGVVANGDPQGNPDAPPLFSPVTIHGATQSGTTVTLTTATPHAFSVSDSIAAVGVLNNGYNVSATVTATTSTTVSYTTTAGLANSGGGWICGNASGGHAAYLMPGASLSQSVTFSGGWADLTLFVAQSDTSSLSTGLTITLTPTNGGPAIGQITMGEAIYPGSAFFFGDLNAYTFCRSTGFYTGTQPYTYTVTFASTLASGTIWFAQMAIQTVNGMFNELTTEAVAQLAIPSVTSDVALAAAYQLFPCGYEGGFTWAQFTTNQNQNNWYHDQQYWTGNPSSPLPNVGAYANADPRTKPLAVDTIDQYYAAGGHMPVIFQSHGNPNVWAVADPTFYDWDTPKLAAIQQVATPPASAAATASGSILLAGL